jgi:Dipeptidyl peptidase IV (DPP IV) N-terminal region
MILQVRLAVVDVDASQIHSNTQQSQPQSQQQQSAAFKPIWMDTLSSYATATASDNATNGTVSDDSYLARVMWIHIQQQSANNSSSTSTVSITDSSSDSDSSCSSGVSRLLAQVQNREQTSLQLLLLDPSNGNKVILLEETSDVWINLHHLLRCLPKVVPVVSGCITQHIHVVSCLVLRAIRYVGHYSDLVCILPIYCTSLSTSVH